MSAGTEAEPRVETAPRTLSDRVLAVLGGAFVLLALVVLIRGGEEDTGGRPVVSPPRITMISPQGGARVTGPLDLVFEVEGEGELRRQPSGWGTGELHIHLRLDGQEYMPSATDIERLPSGAYRWSIRSLDPGTHELRLSWSDAAHQPVAGGGSPAFHLFAR